MNAVYGFTYCLLLDSRYIKYRSCHSYYFQIQLDKKCYLVKIVWLLEWKIFRKIQRNVRNDKDMKHNYTYPIQTYYKSKQDVYWIDIEIEKTFQHLV